MQPSQSMLEESLASDSVEWHQFFTGSSMRQLQELGQQFRSGRPRSQVSRRVSAFLRSCLTYSSSYKDLVRTTNTVVDLTVSLQQFDSLLEHFGNYCDKKSYRKLAPALVDQTHGLFGTLSTGSADIKDPSEVNALSLLQKLFSLTSFAKQLLLQHELYESARLIVVIRLCWMHYESQIQDKDRQATLQELKLNTNQLQSWLESLIWAEINSMSANKAGLQTALLGIFATHSTGIVGLIEHFYLARLSFLTQSKIENIEQAVENVRYLFESVAEGRELALQLPSLLRKESAMPLVDVFENPKTPLQLRSLKGRLPPDIQTFKLWMREEGSDAGASTDGLLQIHQDTSVRMIEILKENLVSFLEPICDLGQILAAKTRLIIACTEYDDNGDSQLDLKQAVWRDCLWRAFQSRESVLIETFEILEADKLAELIRLSNDRNRDYMYLLDARSSNKGYHAAAQSKKVSASILRIVDEGKQTMQPFRDYVKNYINQQNTATDALSNFLGSVRAQLGGNSGIVEQTQADNQQLRQKIELLNSKSFDSVKSCLRTLIDECHSLPTIPDCSLMIRNGVNWGSDSGRELEELIDEMRRIFASSLIHESSISRKEGDDHAKADVTSPKPFGPGDVLIPSKASLSVTTKLQRLIGLLVQFGPMAIDEPSRRLMCDKFRESFASDLENGPRNTEKAGHAQNDGHDEGRDDHDSQTDSVLEKNGLLQSLFDKIFLNSVFDIQDDDGRATNDLRGRLEDKDLCAQVASQAKSYCEHTRGLYLLFKSDS